MRIRDSHALFEKKRHHAAFYLAGYAIECLLKWKITQQRNQVYLPKEFEVHSWDELLPETGIKPVLDTSSGINSIFSELADAWHPELRYLTRYPGNDSPKILYKKTVQIYEWILDHS